MTGRDDVLVFPLQETKAHCFAVQIRIAHFAVRSFEAQDAGEKGDGGFEILDVQEGSDLDKVRQELFSSPEDYHTGCIASCCEDDRCEDEAPTIGRMLLDKKYHGELDATSQGQMLAAQTTAKGSAGYVAIELVRGSLNIVIEAGKHSYVLDYQLPETGGM